MRLIRVGTKLLKRLIHVGKDGWTLERPVGAGGPALTFAEHSAADEDLVGPGQAPNHGTDLGQMTG